MWAEVIETYLCWRDERGPAGEGYRLLKPILEDERVDKYLHDAKKAMVVLGRRGIKLRGVAGDTLLLSYVVDPSFEGESLQDHLFHYWGRVIEQDKFPEKTVGEIINLHSFLLEKCAPELLRLYREVELPLSRVLAEMELAGVKVEAGTLEDISRELGERLEMTEEYLRSGGEEFNINSTRQLGHILFEKLGLPVVKKTKPDTLPMRRFWSSFGYHPIYR